MALGTIVLLLGSSTWTPLPWSLLAFFAVGIAVAVGRVPRAPVLRSAGVLIIVGGIVLGGVALHWSGDRAPAALADQAERMLLEMRQQGEQVAGGVGAVSEDSEPATLFTHLAEVLGRERGPATTLLLVDRDGVARAWAGDGLRHPLPESELPARGWLVLESFTATTVAWIEPVRVSGEDLRVVLGRSESALALPSSWRPSCALLRHCVESTSPDSKSGRAWRLSRERAGIDGSGATLAGGVHRVPVTDFNLSLRESETVELGARAGINVLVPLLLLCLLLVDWCILVASRKPRLPVATRSLIEPLLITLAGLGVVLGSGALRPSEAGLLALQLIGLWVLGAGSIAMRRQDRAVRAHGPMVIGFALATLGALVALALADSQTLIEPGLVAFPSWRLIPSLLLTHGALALGVYHVLTSGPQRLSPRRALLLGGGLLTATLIVPVPLSLIGLLAASLAIPRARRTGATLALLVLVTSAGINGFVWAALQERETNARVLSSVLTDDSPFAGPGRWRVASKLERHFDGADVSNASLGLAASGGWADDLALFLWATSPLSGLDGPSAVRVREGSRSAFFGFGLQHSADGETPVLEQGNTPVRRDWIRDALMRGASTLGSEAHGLIEVEWYVLPLPSGPREAARSLAYRFLLGEPSMRRDWFSNAELRLGPWEGQSMLQLGALGRVDGLPAPSVRVDDSPVGKGWGLGLRTAGSRRAERWFEESFVLARLEWRRDGALRLWLRAAKIASSGLVVAGSGGALGALLLLAARRGPLSLALGPFSRRLMLVFSVFTVVPIVLLTVLLLQSFSGRLRVNQQEAGERALHSAERMLGDYISSLEPGFSVTAALDAELLGWVSSIVRHEVNLYWRGSVLTASRPEIFAAGVLPNQIPGEIYAALADQTNQVAARRNQTATETEYLELYREVEFPGVMRSDLFVSVPLLAQEAQTALTQRQMLAQALALATALALLLVFVAIRFAAAFTEPIRAIVGGTARIAEGAQGLGLEPSIPELRELADAIDEMAGTIAAGRERLVREKRVVDTVIANIKSAVVSFGREERVIMVNREAADLLRVRPGDSLQDVATTLESPEWRALIARRPRVPERISIRIEESSADSHGHESAAGEWTVQWLPIAGDGDPAALLVLEDVTEVLRAQRLEAWAEMARIIAHEVKNPLTPIRLSADHLRQVYETSPERIGEVFDRCIDNILAQVEELRQIAGEFSIYSRIPTADRRALDLVATVQQVTESYRAASTEELEFVVDLPRGPQICLHDPRLIGRVLRNLYENSIRACGGAGRIVLEFEVLAPDPSREHGKPGSWAHLRVTDDGPGVLPRDLERIFEPSFSASSGGTGLGLPISRGIIEEHGGEISARNRRGATDEADGPTGLEVSILLPLVDRAEGSSS